MNAPQRASVAALLGVVTLTACLSSAGPCAATRSVVGTWRYRAIQETPVPSTLSGTLSISRQSCADFQGSLDLLETTAGGQVRRLTGPMSGTVLDSLSARFEATLGPGAREHLARFDADSVYGSWVEIGDASPATGRFTGHLQRP